MSTPASGAAAYCTVAQFVHRVDIRPVQQLCSDTGTPVLVSSLDSNTKLLSLLKEASGLVESAAMVGKQYVIDSSRNDLAALTGNAKEFLVGMVAHLTYWLLWNRRGNLGGPDRAPPLCQMALDWLDALRKGERVFGIMENMDAGNMDVKTEAAVDVERRGGIVYRAERMFGRRVNRLNG